MKAVLVRHARALERVRPKCVRRVLILAAVPPLICLGIGAAVYGAALAWRRRGRAHGLIALGAIGACAVILPVAWGRASWR